MNVELLERPIDLEELYRRVRSDQFGAMVIFTGAVREESDEGRAVVGLHYEAYRELALREMQAIADEVHARWSPCEVAIQHRLGTVQVGDPSVVAAVATPHRAQAFEACRYAIDQLKARVPIWKKEALAGGDAVWRENVR